MTRTKRILAGFDGSAASRDALHLARALAQIKDGQLDVAAVLLHHPLERRAVADPDDAAAYFDRVFSEARRELPGVRISRWELQASDLSAAQALNNLAEQEDVDLIVVGSTHRGALGRVVPGSLSARLANAAPCPVAIAPRGFAGGERFRRGVVGVGYQGQDCETALEWSQQLARELDAKLRVIVTGNPPSGWLEGERTAVVRERLEGALEAAADRAGKVLEVEIEFEQSESAAVVAMHEKELDVLVLGTRGRGVLRRALLPGASGQLARAAPCPVVVVRSGIARRDARFGSLVASAQGD